LRGTTSAVERVVPNALFDVRTRPNQRLEDKPLHRGHSFANYPTHR